MAKKKLKSTDFLYISSRLKSLENYNMTRDRYEKMIEAKSVEDAVTVLSECDYGEGVAADKDDSYEKLFQSELKKYYNLIGELCPDKNIVRFFLYYYDCHNLKSIIKSEAVNADPDYLLIDIGTVSIDKAKYSVRERNFDVYADNMAAAAEEAIESFAKNKDPMLIDIIIDNGCYKDLEVFVKESESKSNFLSELFKMKVDTINILTTIRIIRMKYTQDLLKKTLLGGGSLDKQFFLSNFEGNASTNEKEAKLIDSLQFTEFSPLHDLIRTQGTSTSADVQKTVSLTKIEKLLEEMYNSKLTNVKLIPYGSEVVTAFLVSKEIEIKNVRIILSGKTAKIPNDFIRERLRSVYV